MFVDVGLPTKLRVDPNEPFAYPDDAYPAVIADARHAFGCVTAYEIETAWLDQLDAKGLELSWDPRMLTPYINRGRWLVHCPECSQGAFCWDGMPSACCLACGRVYKVAWHPPKLRAEVIRLLAVRERVNQNWDVGETVEHLQLENRWYLGDVTVEKNGVRMPSRLLLPGELTTKDALADRML